MSTFKDDLGREWTLRLDFAKARQVRDALSLDFVNFDGLLATFAKIDASLDVLMQVLAALLASQLSAQQLSEDQFHSGFSGESFEAARVALEECAVNFSPPRERENLKTALTNQTAMRKDLVKGLVAKMAEAKSAATGG